MSLPVRITGQPTIPGSQHNLLQVIDNSQSIPSASPPPATPEFNPAQLHYLAHIHHCISLRPPEDKRVLQIDPYAVSTDSPSPLQDIRKVLEYMVYDEQSLLAFAYDSTAKKYYVRITREDTEHPNYAGSQLEWFSLAQFKESHPLQAQVPDPAEADTPSFESLRSWSKEKWALLRPAVVTALVQRAFRQPSEESNAVQAVLGNLASGLLLFSNTHPTLKAFMAGLPNPQQCPSLSATHNFYCRWDALHHARKKTHPDHENFLIAFHSSKFLQTACFMDLFLHLAEEDRSVLLQCLFGFSARYHSDYQLKEELLGLADGFHPTYRRLIIDQLIHNMRPDNLAQVCFHEAADQTLMGNILALQLPDRQTLCKSENELADFKQNPDPFFKDFFDAIFISQTKETPRVLQLLISSVFSGKQIARQEKLLHYLERAPAPLLATCLHLIPADTCALFLERLRSSAVYLQLAKELGRCPPNAAIMKLIASRLALSPDLTLENLKKNEASYRFLLPAGDARLLLRILDLLFNEEEELPELFSQVPFSTWETMGGILQKQKDSLFVGFIRNMLNKLPPQASTSFFKGLQVSFNAKGTKVRETLGRKTR